MAGMGRLVLDDGSVYLGQSVGAAGTRLGEMVFNTGMTGYQEVLTDPSYAGQIITMTYPLIGNTGICSGESQADRPHARGLIVDQLWPTPQHARMIATLEEYLEQHGMIGLEGVDTRSLTRKLRRRGTTYAIITTQASPQEELAAQLAACREVGDLVGEVAVKQPYRLPGPGPHLVVVDLGIKRNLLEFFQQSQCNITVVPPSTPGPEILALTPEGVLFSSGPGDPERARAAIASARYLLGKVQLFGICLGHQVLALAQGAATFRLHHGHRGGNHPVRDLAREVIRMTAQNHGYAVDRRSLVGTGFDVTHLHLHDDTVEGLVHEKLRVRTVQYHPEVGPGPRDTGYVLQEFAQALGVRVA